MNIDDLKDAWNKDEPTGMHLAVNTSALKETNSVVGKIRRNMKKEFIATVISYMFMLCFLFFYQQNPFFFITSSALIFTMMIPNGLFFFKFFVFYKSINYHDFNMKKSIRKMAYELELNIELYKAYNICITPLATLIAFGLVLGKKSFDLIQHTLAGNITVSPAHMLILFAVILISYVITYVLISKSASWMYGKHLAELKKIVDDLDTEEGE